VLSVAEYPTHWVVILANPAGHAHAEPVADRPPAWIKTGARVRTRIGLGPGFVCVRDVDRYQLRDGETKQPLTEWSQDLAALYTDAIASGVVPATTVLKDVLCGDDAWVPTLHAPGAARGPSDQQGGAAPVADREAGTGAS
jgi:hypothetical protein